MAAVAALALEIAAIQLGARCRLTPGLARLVDVHAGREEQDGQPHVVADHSCSKWYPGPVTDAGTSAS